MFPHRPDHIFSLRYTQADTSYVAIQCTQPHMDAHTWQQTAAECVCVSEGIWTGGAERERGDAFSARSSGLKVKESGRGELVGGGEWLLHDWSESCNFLLDRMVHILFSSLISEHWIVILTTEG